MNHKLSVTIQVDLDGKHIRVLTTGCLTALSHRALHPLIRRARTLSPGVQVLVDLSGAHHIEAAGVTALRWAIDNDDPRPGRGPVELVLPDSLPDHETAPAQFPVGPRGNARAGYRDPAAA